MRGVPRERRAISRAPSLSISTPRISAERSTMTCSSSMGVELEPQHDPEARPQRRGDQSRARGSADEGERLHVQRVRARRRGPGRS